MLGVLERVGELLLGQPVQLLLDPSCALVAPHGHQAGPPPALLYLRETPARCGDDVGRAAVPHW